MKTQDLRLLADHLEARACGSSLEGYDLVDGLRAAAALLDKQPGPLVHDVSRAELYLNRSDMPLVTLAELLARIREKRRSPKEKNDDEQNASRTND